MPPGILTLLLVFNTSRRVRIPGGIRYKLGNSSSLPRIQIQFSTWWSPFPKGRKCWSKTSLVCTALLTPTVQGCGLYNATYSCMVANIYTGIGAGTYDPQNSSLALGKVCRGSLCTRRWMWCMHLSEGSGTTRVWKPRSCTSTRCTFSRKSASCMSKIIHTDRWHYWDLVKLLLPYNKSLQEFLLKHC